MKKVLLVVLCAVLCIGVVGCAQPAETGVSREEYDALLAEVEALKAEPSTEPSAEPSPTTELTESSSTKAATVDKQKKIGAVTFSVPTAWTVSEGTDEIYVYPTGEALDGMLYVNRVAIEGTSEHDYLVREGYLNGIRSTDGVIGVVSEEIEYPKPGSLKLNYFHEMEGIMLTSETYAFLHDGYVYSFMAGATHGEGTEPLVTLPNIIESVAFTEEPETPTDAATPTPQSTDKSDGAVPINPSAEAETAGQENAVRKAKDYLDYTAFSRKGLIEQLEFEGFTTEEATYGADNSGADWMEQAAKKAQEYLDYTSFSRSGLIDQLKYEGFTTEQATYGVDSVGL